MKKKDFLSEDGLKLLQEAQKNSDKAHFRNRCQAIELRNRGKSVKYLSDLFQVRQEAIYNWIRRWESMGIVGLTILPGRGVKATFDTLLDPLESESVELIKKKIGEKSSET